MDFAADCLCLTNYSISSSQMLKSGSIIMTCILSVIFLNKKIRKYHILGLAITLLGFGIVSYSGNMTAKINESKSAAGGKSISNASTKSSTEGVITMIVAVAILSIKYIIEETLFRKHAFPASRLVAIEGQWGTIFNILSLGLAAYIPCPSDDFCDVRLSSFEKV